MSCPMEFSIDGHNLTIIAADGRSVDQKEVESMILYAGFYSFSDVTIIRCK